MGPNQSKNICNDETNTEIVKILIEINKYLPQAIKNMKRIHGNNYFPKNFTFDENRCNPEIYNEKVKQIEKHFILATDINAIHNRSLGETQRNLCTLIIIVYNLDLFQYELVNKLENSDEFLLQEDDKFIDKPDNNLFNLILSLYQNYTKYKEAGLDFDEFINNLYSDEDEDKFKFKYLKYKKKYLQLKNKKN
jgi:hypothetical protein